MASSWFSVVVDCEDPRGWRPSGATYSPTASSSETDDFVSIAAGDATFPGIEFVLAETHERRKSPLHLDLNPDDQEAEVPRLLALGARRVDVGQPDDARWVVLADPEDNAFCVLAHQASWLDDRG